MTVLLLVVVVVVCNDGVVFIIRCDDYNEGGGCNEDVLLIFN